MTPAARREGDGKRCKRLIRTVVASDEKGRGGDGADITEIQNEFPITPTIETDLYSFEIYTTKTDNKISYCSTTISA